MLTETLIKDGFKLNKHDLCVLRKMVDDKKCTMMRHADDKKASDIIPLVVDNALNLLNSNFGNLKNRERKIVRF